MVSEEHSPRRSSPDEKDSMPNAQYGGIMNDIDNTLDHRPADPTETLKTSSLKKSPDLRSPSNQEFKLAEMIAIRQSQQ